jgi:hypothetical protein
MRKLRGVGRPASDIIRRVSCLFFAASMAFDVFDTHLGPNNHTSDHTTLFIRSFLTIVNPTSPSFTLLYRQYTSTVLFRTLKLFTILLELQHRNQPDTHQGLSNNRLWFQSHGSTSTRPSRLTVPPI